MKKILPVLNLLLIISAISISLYEVITRDNALGLILKDISIIITITCPYWLEKIFKIKFNVEIKFICILFIFCAHFLGATMELYNKIEYYDKFTHTLSGILTAFLSLLFLKTTNKYNSSRWFNILFVISITLMVASCWEFFEYFANILFGGDAQRVELTGVNDTMQDMLVALLGSIIVSIMYVLEEIKHKEGIVNKFMNGINR